MGRKSLCTAARIRTIKAAIENGCTYKLSAEGAGISERTFHKWMAKADLEPTSNYGKLKKAVEEAELECANYLLTIVKRAAIRDWKAAGWMLERRYGYRRDSRNDIQKIKKVELPKEPKALLLMQMQDLKDAMDSARASESWQAFAALQRQLLRCIQDLKQLNAEDGSEALQELSDEQLIQEITAAVVGLPPVLRQQLETNILQFTNVIQMKKA